MSESGTDIVVKGGSVKLLFDSGLYQKDSNDPTTHKHEDRKITRVKVEDENEQVLFDSDENRNVQSPVGSGVNDGLKWTITISTEG